MMNQYTPLFDRFKYHLVIVAVFLLLITAISYLLYPVDLLSSPHVIVGLFWDGLSASASTFGCILTLVVLMSCVVWRSQLSAEFKTNALIQLFLLLILSLGLKNVMKQVTHSPRPYTTVMAQAAVIASPRDFYTFTHRDKTQKIAEMEGRVSHWRWSNWQTEVNYAFPSGHTTFVTLCLLFFSRLFLMKKRYVLCTALLLWAAGVAYSRLWLGMHRPADLFGAIALENVIFLLVPYQYHRLTPWVLYQVSVMKEKWT
ncbi:MAG: phosphatase PAP2 family protein [Vibrio sp.]